MKTSTDSYEQTVRREYINRSVNDGRRNNRRFFINLGLDLGSDWLVSPFGWKARPYPYI